MLCDDLEGWDGGGEVQERENTCIYRANSLCCTTEANTTFVKQPYSNNKLKKE